MLRCNVAPCGHSRKRSGSGWKTSAVRRLNPQPTYTGVARERILAEVHRTPGLEQDGTATCSLWTLQRTLRRATGGQPRVSTYTIWRVLHEGGLSWQKDRSWGFTGGAAQ